MYFRIPDSNLRVLGTLHVLPADRPHLPQFVAAAYKWANRITSEHDQQDFNSLFALMTTDVRISLKEMLSPSTWQILDLRWPKVQNFPLLTACHPWAVWLLGSSFHLESRPGVETYLSERAGQDGKPIEHLEFLTDLVNLLAAIPVTTLCASIEWNMANIPKIREEFRAMYRAWSNCDGGEIARLMEIFRTRSPETHEAMFQKRNKAWAHSFRALMNGSEKTLLAIGAGHLFGPGNIFECAGVTPELVKVA